MTGKTTRNGKEGFYAQGNCIFVETDHGSYACDEYRRQMAKISVPVQTGNTDATMRRELTERVRDLEAEISARDDALNEAATAIEYLRNYPRWRHERSQDRSTDQETKSEPVSRRETDRAIALAKGEEALSKINSLQTGGNSPGARYQERLEHSETRRRKAFGELFVLREALLTAIGDLYLLAKAPHEIGLTNEAMGEMARKTLTKLPENPEGLEVGNEITTKISRMEQALERIRATATELRNENPDNVLLSEFVTLIHRNYIWALRDPKDTTSGDPE